VAFVPSCKLNLLSTERVCLAMTKLISVVIPVNGDAPFLPQAITSVKRQTFRDFELRIILDRPSDKTRKLVDSLRKNDFEIQVMESDKPGISAALNHGISTANSKYIARLDADDLMQPKRLEIQALALENNPNLACLGSQVEYIDEQGKTTGRSNLPTHAWQVKTMMPTLNCLLHPSVMIRRVALVSAGGYRAYLDGVEDYNLWLRLLRFGSLENRKEYLTKYRRHPAQVTKANSSIYPWLDSLARIDAWGYQGLKGPKVWSVYFKSLHKNELEPLVRKLESDATSPWKRNRLQSSRNFSLYFVGPREERFGNIMKALVRTPFKTLWLAVLVFVQKLKSL
jgi:glycosyltransferase involved in cell wall biosynthesis